MRILAVSALDSRPAAETLLGLARIGVDTHILAPTTGRYTALAESEGANVERLTPRDPLSIGATSRIRGLARALDPDVLYLDAAARPRGSLIAAVAAHGKVVVRQSYLECAPVPSTIDHLLCRSSRVVALLCDMPPNEAGDPLTASRLGQKISVLADGHSPDWYESDPDLRELGVPDGAFTIASVSDGHRLSGLRWVIAAAHWIPMDLPIHFLLVAPQTEHERLRRMIRKMPFTQRFHLCDQLDRAPGLVGTSNVAVVADWSSELQRRSCMQGLSAGVPVLAIDDRMTRRVVRPNINGELFASDNPEALAHSLFELYEDQSRRSMLCDGAKRSVSHCLTMAQHLLQLRGLLESAVAD